MLSLLRSENGMEYVGKTLTMMWGEVLMQRSYILCMLQLKMKGNSCSIDSTTLNL